jgi:hypothetical protein
MTSNKINHKKGLTVMNFEEERRAKKNELKNYNHNDIDHSGIIDLGKIGKIMNIGKRFIVQELKTKEKIFFTSYKEFMKFLSKNKGREASIIVFQSYVMRDMNRTLKGITEDEEGFIYGSTLEDCIQIYFNRLQEDNKFHFFMSDEELTKATENRLNELKDMLIT